MNKVYNIINNYVLIGVGEFSHGINESWMFRFNLLKYVIKYTTKNIIIFNEIANWQAMNIINNTYIDVKTNKFKKYQGIKYEHPMFTDDTKPPWGTLWQYCFHTNESPIYVKIIKYIRKHKNRITMIGIDNETLARDYEMYTTIMNNLDKNKINFIWTHNSHIDSRKLDWFDYKWTKKQYPLLKYRCGYYLKKKFKNEYCIILTQAYKGTIRFDSFCVGNACETRIWLKNHIVRKFKYNANTKYVSKSWKIYTIFDNDLIEFSNSYFKNTTYGECSIGNSNKWDYILFFPTVTSLDKLNL